jgi:hypothetical protein
VVVGRWLAVWLILALIALVPRAGATPQPYGTNDAGGFPFQNRPTFQQVATPTRRLPR